MSVRSYLTDRDVPFEVTEHDRTVDAQHIAAVEHVTGWDVAKPVVLRVDGELALAVVPAPMYVDEAKASAALGGEVTVAAESDFAGVFEDCESGAQPPFGAPYGLPVYLDQAMRARERLVCRDGTHTATLELSMDDYLRVADVRVVDLAVLR